MSYPTPYEIYRAAVVAERMAWDDVRDKLPGSPDFDEAKWNRWRGAMTTVVHALDRMRGHREGIPESGWTSRHLAEKPVAA